MTQSLKIIEDRLTALKNSGRTQSYYIPTLWLDSSNAPGIENVNPFDFFLNKITEIRTNSCDLPKINNREEFMKNASVYNLFVRHTTAFDHNNDGRINIADDVEGFLETGTFLKAIAILPYIKSLGINTIYLLPITSIGIAGKKGTLGSPYAIRNPYKIDENLAEPILELDPETEFQAFVEAAHLLGMRVVLEFVFRTASIDSDLAIEHPNWFYWIKDDIKDRPIGSFDETMYGSPLFADKEIEAIKEKVENGDFSALPEPHSIYKEFFTETPPLVTRTTSRICGIISRNKECRIPCAFADWPPDDTQPVWSDVTYLKMYEHEDFNYIAYNTVRMYDESLAVPENRVLDLWENVKNIIPHYQQNFSIDGVMVDMGHAMPIPLMRDIVKTAREANPNFIFWEENFLMTEKSKTEGYDAVVGYFVFDSSNPEKINKLIQEISENGSPIHFFGTGENHNTPRVASREGECDYSKFLWKMIALLPVVPFIHSGFELGETRPVNTGLGFSVEELYDYPAEKLPLFSHASLKWEANSEIITNIKQCCKFRNQYSECCNFSDYKTLVSLKNSCSSVVSFIRTTNNEEFDLMFLGNMNAKKELYFCVKLPEGYTRFIDDETGKFYLTTNDEIILSLKPFEVLFGKIYK